jgi:hypothetical protein
MRNQGRHPKYDSEPNKYTPYTLTPNNIANMHSSARRMLVVNPYHPVKDEICQNRAGRYLICSGCKETFAVGDCVVRFGCKGHYCHYPKCYGKIFVGSDDKESSITANSFSPSSTSTGESRKND